MPKSKKSGQRLPAKREIQIAEKIRAWQRTRVAARCPVAKLAQKLGLSPNQLRLRLEKPEKRLRRAEDRVKLNSHAKKSAAAAAKVEFTKEVSIPAHKIVEKLGITTYSVSAVRKSQKVARQAIKKRKGEILEQRQKEAAEFAARLRLPEDHPDAIRQSQPIWYERD